MPPKDHWPLPTSYGIRHPKNARGYARIAASGAKKPNLKVLLTTLKDNRPASTAASPLGEGAAVASQATVMENGFLLVQPGELCGSRAVRGTDVGTDEGAHLNGEPVASAARLHRTCQSLQAR